MRIKTSSYITALKGAIGGTVALTQNSQNFLRTKKHGVTKITSKSRESSSAFAQITRAWKTLSDLDRASWNNPLRNHSQNFISFVGFNMVRLKIGLPVATYSPAIPLFPVTPTIEGTYNSTSQQMLLSVTNGFVNARFKIRIDITIPLVVSSQGRSKNYFYTGTFTATSGFQIDLTNYCLQTFGAFRSNTIFYVRFRTIDMLTGYQSISSNLKIMEYVGMTQHNVTGSRFLGINYHNTTGKDMFVSIRCLHTYTDSAICYSDTTPNPTQIVSWLSANSGFTSTNFFVVPAGSYYKCTFDLTGNLLDWIEWY